MSGVAELFSQRNSTTCNRIEMKRNKKLSEAKMVMNTNGTSIERHSCPLNRLVWESISLFFPFSYQRNKTFHHELWSSARELQETELNGKFWKTF